MAGEVSPILQCLRAEKDNYQIIKCPEMGLSEEQLFVSFSGITRGGETLKLMALDQ